MLTKFCLLNQVALSFFWTDSGERTLVEWCNEQRIRKVPQALDFWTLWVFIFRQGVIFECLPNTHSPPHSFPCMLPFFVWCRGYCFKRQLLFFLSGKPSSFTSPEMKAKSRLWECSLKSLLKRDSYHHSTVWELHFPCFPLIIAERVSVGFFW